MSDIFLAEFRERHLAAQRERQALRNRLWAERNAQVALIEDTIPNFRTFNHNVEVAYNTRAAVATGVLQRLIAEGYAKTFPDHVTVSKFREAHYVPWAIEWLTPQVLTVDTESTNLGTSDSVQRVTLMMTVDADSRTIDTEFFSWNSRVGQERNIFEDTEKLHIVWYVSEGSEVPELKYVGFGSNEPHDLEHPEKLSGVAPRGKPRFFIHDVDRKTSVVHDVTWEELGVFDWDWSHIPIRSEGGTTTVQFVRFPDGSTHCISDRYLASAGAELTRDMMIAELWASEQQPGTPPRFQDLGLKVQQAFSALFVRVAAHVSPYRESSQLQADLMLSDVVARARRDYLAYFVAKAGVEARSSDLLSAWKRLQGSRASQYAAILDASTSSVFVSPIAEKLPPTAGGVIEANLSIFDAVQQTDISAWREKLVEEIRADLYFYGQYPDARLGRLLFAVELATLEDYGAPYHALLKDAVAVINGNKPFGARDIRLPEPG